MGQGIDEKELRRRAIDGVRDEVEAFGSGAPSSQLMRRQGLVASLTPASPRRSLFNSVFLDDPEVLAREYEALAEIYAAAGVQAWTVWVADEDRASAQFLAGRDHVLDAAPRVLLRALAAARAAGALTASLQATKAGAPIYERLGFRDFGFIEMWELRR